MENITGGTNQDDILERLISVILKDLISAQHSANKKSARIATEYMKGNEQDKLLPFFDVPCAEIKSFVFELKFGLDSGLDTKVEEHIQEVIKNYLNKLELTERTRLLDEFNLKQLSRLIISLLNSSDPSDGMSTHKDMSSAGKALILKLKEAVLDEKSESNFNLDNNQYQAIFELKELEGISPDIICSVKVEAEVRGLRWGYVETSSGTVDDTNLTKNDIQPHLVRV